MTESLRDQVGRIISEHLAEGIDICNSNDIDIIADEVLKVVARDTDVCADRWRFMMAVADDEDGPEAKAVYELGNNQMEKDRPNSVQMNELTDKAMAMCRTGVPS